MPETPDEESQRLQLRPGAAAAAAPLQSKAISWRYWCMRVTSCPVPFLRASFPFIGGHSLIEVVCIILLLVIAVLISLPDFKDAGSIGDFLGGATIALGLRNNILNVILGISYERALFWHKVLATATVVVIVIHALTGMNFSGTMMLVAMVAMGMTYLIKNQDIPYAFEIFYYTHLSCMLLLMMMGALHGTPVTLVAGTLWLLDVVMRSSVHCQCHSLQATATQLPGDVIRLTFDQSVRHRAGQYTFLRIPAVSAVEFHPFSFSSSPHEEATTMHVRELGDWTRRLGDLVREHDREGCSVGRLSLEVMLDGPYGSHMIDMESSDYEVFLLISGGIGITPNQSIYNHLIAQVEAGRALQRGYFVWSVKDRALVDCMTPSLLVSPLTPDHTPLSFQPGMTGRASKAVGRGDGEGDVFVNHFHLTRVRDEDDFERANINPKAQPWLAFGRPDIASLFQEARSFLQESRNKRGGGGKRVAVSVCGPPGLVQTVQDLCRLSQGSTVPFDCHAEVFDM